MLGRHKRELEEQQQLLARAGAYIQRLQEQLRRPQQLADGWQGGKRYVLSQLEGAWEVPVRWAEGPAGLQAVVALEGLEPPLAPLTVFGLQNAFADRARLEELASSGWALVRAWPLNAPGALEQLPGQSNERYALCALTSQALRQAGQPRDMVEATLPRLEARL